MKVVISIKYGWNTIAWVRIMHLRHYAQDLLVVKIHTSSKISKFCCHCRGTESDMGEILGI